jgi:hypothetical protein
MILADAASPNTVLTSVVSTLDGVTTVLVLFMFTCLVMPSLVRNRNQFYAGLAAVLGLIVLHTAALMFDTSPAWINLTAVGTGFLQLAAILLFVLCVGGLTAKQLAGDMARAYEVMRRGETHKEVIIPIGDQPRRAGKTQDAGNKVYKIDTDDDDEEDKEEDKGIPLS